MKKIVAAPKAIDMIPDGATVAVTGFVGFGVPEELLIAMEERFLEHGSPHNLTIMYCNGMGDVKGPRGMNHLAHEGLVTRLICGHLGMSPRLGKLVAENKIECFSVPLGVLHQILRNTAGGKPGVLTHVGLGTFADPRIEGCKANSITKGEIVEVMSVGGKECLFYKAFPINVAIIRGTTADTHGNISLEKEAMIGEQQNMAAAVRNSGGIVIVQVEQVVEYGNIRAMDVKIPGIMVDYVVVAKPENHRQTFIDELYHPEYSGRVRVPVDDLPPLPLDARKICCRRAAMEAVQGAVVNLGVGVPEGVARVIAEEGLAHRISLSMESGAVGGIPLGGLGIGASINPDCILDQGYQFDFYDGGGIDLACLGLAEADADGNLNVSKFGGRAVGPGGFINITQNAKAVVFCGTFTAGGLKETVRDGKLVIIQEGRSKKFVRNVEQITFSGKYAASVGQKVLFVTERAVFELRREGMVLVEIAPGINLERDILQQMEFEPVIPKKLKLMDERIFVDTRMGLKI